MVVTLDDDALGIHDGNTSSTVAMPWPTPIHMVARP